MVFGVHAPKTWMTIIKTRMAFKPLLLGGGPIQCIYGVDVVKKNEAKRTKGQVYNQILVVVFGGVWMEIAGKD